jgi:hypothetical protein
MRFLASLIFFALLPSYAQVYSPMTGSERAKYYVQDTFRLRSFLLSGPAVAGMRTWQDRPEEWDRTWGGFGKRYAARVAVNTISNSTEIGLGAIWKEDPRYFPKATGKLSSRIGEAARQAVLSRYANGNYYFGAAKAAGIVAGSFTQKLYMPDSVISNRDCTIRIGGYYAGRLVSNLFVEFRPQIRRIFRRK